MLRGILDEARQYLLQQLRQQLGDLRVVLIRIEAPDEDQKALARSIAQLDQLFLLVVVGEFNSGKSAVINALLGERVLEEGVTPTTSRIELLRHGPKRDRAPAGGGFEEISLPFEILREMNVVDTPGTNAVVRSHEALARDFVPRSDLVLFVTSADRPFTESERAFLEAIRAWGKKVVVAVNKIDILDKPQDVQTVVEFVRDNMRTLLGLRPEVFAVSARLAQRAKAGDRASDLSASGFGALEAYVTRTLDDAERVRLKLLNPLGVASRVLDQAASVVKEQLAVLDADQAALREIESQLALHRDDLGRELRLRLPDVERPIHDLEQRGEGFLERTVRLGAILDLADREGFRSAFERDVISGLAPSVEKRVDGIVDLLVAGETRLWPAVADRVKRRQAAHGTRVPGLATETAPPDRARMLSAVRREAQRVLEAYDHRAEALHLAGIVRRAAAAAALLLVGAIVAGAVALATRTTGEWALLLAAALMAAAGLVLLPACRRREAARLRAGMVGIRQKLTVALRAGFERELDASRQRVLEAIAPFSSFVRSEGGRLRGQQDELAGLRTGLEVLRGRVEALR
jgi:small GTP-binding protein